MDYYTVVSRDNNVLIKMLLDEISDTGVKTLNDWHTCYHLGIDGYLVNIVYNIIHDEGIYDKEEIDTRFDEILKPVYDKTSILNDKQFYDIFNTVWRSVFEISPLKYRFIKTLAYKNQPAWRKAVNSNWFMGACAIALLITSAVIGGGGSFIALLCIMYMGCLLLARFGIAMGYFLTFVAGCVLAFILSFAASENKVADLNEGFLLAFILSLLMIPVLKVNEKRIKDVETEQERFYRKLNNVK